MNKYLGHGEFGTCYLMEDGRVFKYFDRMHEKPFINKELVGRKNDTYIFYDELEMSYDMIKGAYSKYIDSLPLDETDMKIDDLINSIDKVYDDTKKISNEYILTCDVRPKNMLYDGKLRIIDTDLYSFEINDDPKDLEYKNICNVNNGIGELLFSLKFNMENIRQSDELFQLYVQTFISTDNKTLKEFLMCLKKTLEDNNFKNVSEYRRYLER